MPGANSSPITPRTIQPRSIDGNGSRAVKSLLRPDRLLLIAVAYAIAVGFLITFLATDRPWLGLRLAFDASTEAAVVKRAEGPAAGIPLGTALTGIADGAGNFRFVAGDFIIETDGVLPTYADYGEFLQRQDRLAELQSREEITFVDTDGRAWEVRPLPSRPITTLPPEFWVQLSVGLMGWLIAASVWVFRQREQSARYLLLSGWCTCLFAPAAAVYSTRELGLPGELFRWLSDLNFLGGSLFAGTMVALLACYPRRIGPVWLGLAAVLAQGAWWVAQQSGMFESMTFARRILVMVAVLGTFVLAGLQWRRTRRDPVGRAALRWFLLSWVAGSSIFALLILLPQMFGFDTTSVQPYAFLLFVLVYAGLALGILRFRLFGLDEWWARVVTWLGALLLLVVLDLVFLLQLNFSTGASLSLSLILCGLLWLPLRGYLSSRLVSRSERHRPDIFKAVVDVALATDPADQVVRWKACLQAAFDPLRVGAGEHENARPALGEDGLALLVPPVEGLPPLRVEYAWGGRGLFGPRDLVEAEELVGMLRHTLASRHAFERGVLQERARIARDMHDNLGAQLLRALHTREDSRRQSLLRETLTDLRGIINDFSNHSLTLEESLADLRYESSELLAAAGIELEWRVDSTDLDGSLFAKAAHGLRPLVREAISNIVKHARARSVGVSIVGTKDALEVAIEDDGTGFDSDAVNAGHGLSNMRARVTAVAGRIAWSAGERGGTRIAMHLPLAEHSTSL